MNQVFRQGKLRLELVAAARIDTKISFGVVAASAVFFCTGWASLAFVLLVIAVLIWNPFSSRGWIAPFLALWGVAGLFYLYLSSEFIGGADWIRSAIAKWPFMVKLFNAINAQVNVSSTISSFFIFATQLGIATLVIKLVHNTCDRSEVFEFGKNLPPRLKKWIQPITTGWIMFYLFSIGLLQQVHENLVARGFWPSRTKCPYYHLPIIGLPASILHLIFCQFISIYLPTFLSACSMIAFDRGQTLIIAANTRLHIQRKFPDSYLTETNRIHDIILIVAIMLITSVAGYDYLTKLF